MSKPFTLTEEFELKRVHVKGKELDELRQHYFIQAQMNEIDDASIAGLSINQSGRHGFESSTSKKKKKQSNDDLLFMTMLDSMRNELARLDASLARQFEALKEKYGDDVVSGMAETYLTEEELSGLITDEDKLNALADKMLDENGNIKSEYKDLDEAKYIRDWKRTETLRPIVQKFEGHNELTLAERQEVLHVAEKADLVDNATMMALSNNKAVDETINNELENQLSEKEAVQQSSNLTFG